jgi:hypothetical protein
MSSCKRGDKKYVDVWFLFTVDNADNDGRSNFKNYLPTIKRLTNRMNHNGNGDAFSLLRFVENLYTVCGSPSKCGTFLTNRETFTLLALSPLRGRFASSIAASVSSCWTLWNQKKNKVIWFNKSLVEKWNPLHSWQITFCLMQLDRHTRFVFYICAYCNKSAFQKYDPGDIPSSEFSRPKWQYLPLLFKSMTGGSGCFLLFSLEV